MHFCSDCDLTDKRHNVAFAHRPISRWVTVGFAWSILLLLSVGSVNVSATDPIEPEVAGASAEGKEAMEAIRIPNGWKVQLFAAEPMVANVVAFDIDHQGRFYICETFRQNRGVTDNRGHDDQWLLADLAAETVQDRIDYHRKLLGDAAVTYEQHDDRLRLLEDTNGDRVADTSKVIAKGFNHLEEGTGASVLWRPSGIYYTCIPKLWQLIDSNADGVIDERIVMSDGYGVRVAFRGHDLHGLTLGPDGRLYFSIGDRGYHVTTDEGDVLANPVSGAVFRCELDGSQLEVFASGLRNPQELAFNDVGDFFTVDNNSDSGDQARVVHLLQDGDSGWRMYYQYLPDRGPFNRESIWQPLHPQQPAYIVPPVANFTDGPSGLAYYPGTGFGDQFNDTFFICDFRGGPANSGVRTFRVEPEGASYRFASDADPIWTILATDIGFGPDGAIYVSDWVNGWDGLGKGRIYRFSDPEYSDTKIVSEVREWLSSNWEELDRERLVAGLSHVDRRIRLESQWQLAQRLDWRSLVKVATDRNLDAVARLHGIWGADQIARQNDELSASIVQSIRPLLNSDDSLIRSAATNFAGERGDQQSVSLIRKNLEDGSARVKYFAMRALSALRDEGSLDQILAAMIEDAASDVALRHAGIIALANTQSPQVLGSLKDHPSEIVRISAVVALRRLRHANVAAFLNDSSDWVASEAGRAIYDLPIPEAMPQLSELAILENHSLEFQRRILNAGHRVGTPQAAQRLVSFAASPSTSVSMRLEALNLLENWNQTDPRDRVLNDYRPLTIRSTEIAVNALAPQLQGLMVGSSEVRDEAIRVASQLGIKGIAPMLVTRVANQELSAAERASALEALSRLDTPAAVELALNVRMLPADELLLAGLRILAQHAPSLSKSRLIEATESRDLRVRQLAWDLLAKLGDIDIRDVVSRGVERYLAGELPASDSLNVLEAAEGKLSDDLVVRIRSHLEKLNEKDPLGRWLNALEGGDVESGRKLFFEDTRLSCLRCHQVGRAGGQVGPNLTTIAAKKDRRYLLESICTPNAVVAEGFETALVLTTEGETIAGIVKLENDESLDLIKADGSLVRVDLEEIEARRKGKSSMPEDLIDKLTMRQLRDLVAYLASLTTDLRSADEVE